MINSARRASVTQTLFRRSHSSICMVSCLLLRRWIDRLHSFRFLSNIVRGSIFTDLSIREVLYCSTGRIISIVFMNCTKVKIMSNELMIFDVLIFIQSINLIHDELYTLWSCSIKNVALLLSISSTIIDRFSKFFYWHNLQTVCNNRIII